RCPPGDSLRAAKDRRGQAPASAFGLSTGRAAADVERMRRSLLRPETPLDDGAGPSRVIPTARWPLVLRTRRAVAQDGGDGLGRPGNARQRGQWSEQPLYRSLG